MTGYDREDSLFHLIKTRLLTMPITLLAALASSSAALADRAEFALQLPVNHQQLSTMVNDMESPNSPRNYGYSPEEIRDRTAISPAQYTDLLSALRSLRIPTVYVPASTAPTASVPKLPFATPSLPNLALPTLMYSAGAALPRKALKEGETVKVTVRETRSHHYIILEIDNLPTWITTKLATMEASPADRNKLLQDSVLMELPPNLRNLVTGVLDSVVGPKVGPRVAARLAKAGSGNPTVLPQAAVHSPDDLPGVHPDTIRNWYGVTALRNKYGLTGKGQKIAAISMGAVSLENVAVYDAIDGIRGQPPIQIVRSDTNEIPSPLAVFNEIENDTDLEMAGNVAPGANLYSFNGSDVTMVDWVEIMDNILDQDDIKIVTNSYMGIGEPSCETASSTPSFSAFMDPLFDRAVAQGVTVINASGDLGSDGCGDGTVQIEWPSSPDILQAGGTQMKLGSAPQSVTEELAWTGGAGGESILYWKPEWMSTPAAGYAASLSHRAEPDIAWYTDVDYNDPGLPKVGQPVFTLNPFAPNPELSSPVWSALGGTSLAAPSLAGFLALVNEARTNAGKPPLLYVTPMLYRVPVARTASTPFIYSDLFNDIVDGNNGAYYAHSGWDMTTGLGTIKAEALLQYLVAQ